MQWEMYIGVRLNRKEITLVSVDDFPEDIGIGCAYWFSLEEDRLDACDEWGVDDEGVAEYPSDV